MRVSIFLLVLVFLSGCVSGSDTQSSSDTPLVQSEYKLKEDREAFEQIRKEIPQSTQESNDELAFIEQLFSQPLKAPSEIREKFQKSLQKKRELLNRDLNKSRQTFVKIEQKERDSFTKKINEKRAQFKSQKLDREKTKEFYDELDLERRDFNAAQKQKRDLFEEQIRDARKNFEDYAKEKQSDFSARLKTFTEKQKEISESQQR